MNASIAVSPAYWEEIRRKWQQAFDLGRYGVVGETRGRKQELHLQLWRAMLEVHNYVCLVPAKRAVLRAVVGELQDFKAAIDGGHRSCLLVAPPGSGKTLLARRLAEHLGLGFLEFNITQMLYRDDILECFDTIVTTQLQNQDKKFPVFVDEINASLDGQDVYSAFLAPLERGVYIRAGKTFQIAPCAWIFASTKDPTEGAERTAASNKASDFISRLTLVPKPLVAPKEEESWARLEKVYLGVCLLRSNYPDVSSVSQKVLAAFHMMSPDLAVRKLEQFVKSFVNIQYGKVRGDNVPKERLQELGVDQKFWEGFEEKEDGQVFIGTRVQAT